MLGPQSINSSEVGGVPTKIMVELPGSTPLSGLYGDVLLDRLWFYKQGI